MQNESWRGAISFNDGMAALAPQRPDLTRLLNAWGAGDSEAAEELFRAVYPDLKRMVARRRRPVSLVQVTEVVHESVMRLFRDVPRGFECRAQFFELTSRIVRQVLVDQSRRRQAFKRGRDWCRTDLAIDQVADSRSGSGRLGSDGTIASTGPVDPLDLSRALDRLAEIDGEAARVVELRYFAGLTIPEVAQTLAIGTATVSRRWQMAQAWLRRELASSS